MVHVEKEFPWKLTEVMLNYLYHACESEPRMDSDEFPSAPKSDQQRPLPEDYALRGLVFAEGIFPSTWFTENPVEEDEKQFELPSMTETRRERLLWLGRRIAASGRWLTWDSSVRRFGVTEDYAVDVEDISLETNSEGEQGPLLHNTPKRPENQTLTLYR
jgi:hypothetical protein